jgi:hypothetical protein
MKSQGSNPNEERDCAARENCELVWHSLVIGIWDLIGIRDLVIGISDQKFEIAKFDV